MYERYRYKPEYDPLPKTMGAFAIIAGECDGKSAVLIKQRNGKGASPFLFDLPGGRFDCSRDGELAAAAIREAAEEVGILVKKPVLVGQPLWLPISKDGVLLRVDGAQAFLVQVEGTPSPRLSEESINWAFVNECSIDGFRVVGKTDDPDPAKRAFDRTPVMIFDGLSVLREPFYTGPVTREILDQLSGADQESSFQLDYLGLTLHVKPKLELDYVLSNDGAYLAKYTSQDSVSLFFRLNPHQEDGRFKGNLEHLVHKV